MWGSVGHPEGRQGLLLRAEAEAGHLGAVTETLWHSPSAAWPLVWLLTVTHQEQLLQQVLMKLMAQLLQKGQVALWVLLAQHLLMRLMGTHCWVVVSEHGWQVHLLLPVEAAAAAARSVAGCSGFAVGMTGRQTLWLGRLLAALVALRLQCQPRLVLLAAAAAAHLAETLGVLLQLRGDELSWSD